MKPISRMIATVILALAGVFPGFAAPPPAGPVTGEDEYEYVFAPREALAQWAEGMHGRVEIGTRSTFFQLLEDSRSDDPGQIPTFVGFLNELDADQNPWPLKLFVDGWFNTYAGVELTYDVVTARTYNENIHTSDGEISMVGPIASFLLRCPFDYGFEAYGGLGLAWMLADFDEETWWSGGWESPDEFETAGGQGTSPSGRRREMHVEDDLGFALSAGVIYRITDHLAADILLRYLHVTADATFVGTVNDQVENVRNGAFTMEHIAYGLGLRYAF